MMNTKEDVINAIRNRRIRFATVSGVMTTKPGIIDWVDRKIPEIGIITTKSYQVLPNPGNSEPIIVEDRYGCFGNAVGLRNPGMNEGILELSGLRRRRSLRAILNVSLSASNPEDFITLVTGFGDIADMFELNFSCPHAAPGFGSSIGAHPALVSEYVTAVRAATERPLFVKLTPNTEDIGFAAEAAVSAGADGISAINTAGPEVYYEPVTGEPVLSNPNGRKGGKSGIWIRETALQCVSRVRTAVGNGVPIIGMGGVFTTEDVQRMTAAGADVIGLGSVFAQVTQSNIPEFVKGLTHGMERSVPGILRPRCSDEVAYLNRKRVARYKPYQVEAVGEEGDLRVISLRGKMHAEPSQYAFLWIPGTGEKPFSIVKTDPLTFVIRKREHDPGSGKGLVSNALFNLLPGDSIMVRGPYGKGISPGSREDKIFLVAGGTGTVVIPLLYRYFVNMGREVEVWIGTRDAADKKLMQRWVLQHVQANIFIDDNGVCKVLKEMEKKLHSSPDARQPAFPGEAAAPLKKPVFFNIGPLPFMEHAAAIEREAGASPKSIYLSLETNTMCGIGLCGECACGDTLTCQEGTFLSLAYLEHHEIDLGNLYHTHPSTMKPAGTVQGAGREPLKQAPPVKEPTAPVSAT